MDIRVTNVLPDGSARVVAPDGREGTVPPRGGDASDAPVDVQWDNTDPARGTANSGNLASTLKDLMRKAGQGYETNVRQPTAAGVEQALSYLPFAQGPGTKAAIHGVAQAAVPTTTGLGIIGASALTGGMGTIPAIGMAGLGGAVGGAFEPDASHIVRGGLEGLAAGVTGAGMAGAAGYPYRALRQQAADELAVGRTVGELSPELGMPAQPTRVDLRNVLTGTQGEQNLSAAYRGTRQQTADFLRGQPGVQPPGASAPLPASSGAARVAPDAVQSGFPTELARPPDSGLPVPLSSNQILIRPGSALDELFTGEGMPNKGSATFEEAARQIELLQGGRHPLTTKLTGSQSGAEERRLKAAASSELQTQIAQYDPAVAAVWREASDKYGTGWEMLRTFRERGIFDPVTNDLDMSKLQLFLTDNRAKMENMVGQAGYETLRRAAYRNAPVGSGTDYTRPIFGGGRERISMPLPGAIPGGASMPISINAPTHYVGDRLTVPSMPFVGGVGSALPAWLNPYLNSRP